MPFESTMWSMPRCLNCGFEAPMDDDEWNTVEAPPLGDLTQCPDCDSTNIRGQW